MKIISKCVAIGLIVSAGFVGQALADNANVHNPQGQFQNVVYTKKAASFTVSGTNAMVTPSSLGRGSVIAYVAQNNSQIFSVVVQGPGGQTLAEITNVSKNNNGTYTAVANINGATLTLTLNSNGSLAGAVLTGSSNGLANRAAAAAGA